MKCTLCKLKDKILTKIKKGIDYAKRIWKKI